MKLRFPWRRSESSLQVVTTIAQARSTIRGPMVAAVYTMGALHEGHAHLIRAARKYIQDHSVNGGQVVVSIFVNPTQFTNEQDLAKYPRTYRQDVILCKKEQVDVVFVPSDEQMYPNGSSAEIAISPGPSGDILEGLSRPGHFTGVLTVVNKLTNIIEPDVMFFGEKDFQQLSLIRQMVDALNINTAVVSVPTAREEDGLARSSRNKRLQKSEREQACHLYAALTLAKHAIAEGKSPAQAELDARQYLEAQPGIALDYFVILNEKLQQPAKSDQLRAFVAATVGQVRLIDNLALEA